MRSWRGCTAPAPVAISPHLTTGCCATSGSIAPRSGRKCRSRSGGARRGVWPVLRDPGRATMYTPTAFAVTDTAALHDHIDEYGFGTLISAEAGGPVATHLPFLVDRNRGPCGRLVCHMA